VEEQASAVAGDGDVLAVREGPERAAGARVPTGRPVFEGGRVHDPCHDLDRAGDTAAGRTAPEEARGARSNAVDAAGIGPEVDAVTVEGR
jgi:hypothetical protein